MADDRRALVPVLVREPGLDYFVHIGTKNESFLRVSMKLKGLGVNNNKFMLALFDENLAGVDPSDPGLPEETCARVLQEVVRNPWYFWREVIRVPVPGGQKRFILHLGNLALLWCMIVNINSYLILPRQNYKTFSAAAFYLWVFCFAAQNTHILFFNKEHGDSKNNLRRLKDMMQLMPSWMQDVTTHAEGDGDNVEYISSALRKNRIDAKPSGKDLNHANNLGRGSTTPLLWYDEIAFMRFVKETFMAAAPARGQASIDAKENGIPYGTCITTTPNNVDDRDGSFAHEIMKGALPFREEFYDLGADVVRDLMETQAKFSYVFIQYDYKAIGRSEQWFNQQSRELLGDRVKIKRELLMDWPLSGDNSVFLEEELESLKEKAKKPIATQPLLGREGALRGMELIYVEPLHDGVPYIIGLDTSGNQGAGDFTAWVVADPVDFRTVAYMRTNTADHELVKAAQVHLMRFIMPQSIAVVERNHYLGVVVIEHLLKQPDLQSRVFYLEKVKVAEKTVGKKRVATKGKVRVYGVHVNAAERGAMIDILFDVMDRSPELIQIEEVADEVRTLHRTKNNKIEHRPGCHDDLLFAWLHIMYAARNQQPVLRRMIRAVGGMPGFVNRATDIVAANVPEVDPAGNPTALSAAGGTKEIDMEKYREAARAGPDPANAKTDEEAKRRRLMSGLVMNLNSGGDFPS